MHFVGIELRRMKQERKLLNFGRFIIIVFCQPALGGIRSTFLEKFQLAKCF